MTSKFHQRTVELSSGWEVKQTDDSSEQAWMPVKRLPTEIHVDLLNNTKIPDPYLDLNELEARWVADKAWTYRTTFSTPKCAKGDSLNVELIFQGLDTFATVYLNGEEILKSDNMFIEHRVGVKDFLKPLNQTSPQNLLEIVFESARLHGLDLTRQHPEHRFIVHQTEVSRGPVRKAQYHWGWDWGPILTTCGPWKPILLEVYKCRIDDVWVEYDLDQDLETVKGKVYAKIDGYPADRVQFELQFQGATVRSGDMRVAYKGEKIYISEFEIDKPNLWWPCGYGDQSRYQLAVQILDQSQIFDQKAKVIGFRRTKLIQDPDSFGTSFYFRINNVDIFAGGACWVPADSFVSQINDDRYRSWIKLMKEGGQSMLRVWGGGIYESDALYDACDEFGILLWQDFMFACASYPTYPEYLESVEREARYNLQRLRHHPSIILWCGNNEDYQLIERYGLEYDFEGDKDPQSWLRSTFPARYIYEYLLPNVVKEEMPGMIYHPSSPWGNGTSTTLVVDPKVGDIHQWNVWHGTMEPYQKLPQMGGRFVSEFGMEAYPHISTLRKMSTEAREGFPSTMVLDFHNKAINHHRRIMTYVCENFNLPSSSNYERYFKNFTSLTQVLQADAMSTAYKSWRKDFGQPGKRKCGGVLVWQLNDCWPTISWAVVDYYLVPKPAYYAIKRALLPVAVGVRRTFFDWTTRKADENWGRDTGHVDPSAGLTGKGGTFDVWIASSRLEEITANVIIKFISVQTGNETTNETQVKAVIRPNQTTNIIEGQNLPSASGTLKDDKLDTYIIHASLYVNGCLISEDLSWPDPIKYLDMSERNIQIQHSHDRRSVTISVQKPVKGFVFAQRPGLSFSDNGFDLVPGSQKTVKIQGLDEMEELDWTFVGKEE